MKYGFPNLTDAPYRPKPMSGWREPSRPSRTPESSPAEESHARRRCAAIGAPQERPGDPRPRNDQVIDARQAGPLLGYAHALAVAGVIHDG